MYVKKLKLEIRSLLEGMKVADHVDYELDYLHGYPVLVNHEKEVALIEKLVTKIYLKQRLKRMNNY